MSAQILSVVGSALAFFAWNACASVKDRALVAAVVLAVVTAYLWTSAGYFSGETAPGTSISLEASTSDGADAAAVLVYEATSDSARAVRSVPITQEVPWSGMGLLLLALLSVTALVITLGPFESRAGGAAVCAVIGGLALLGVWFLSPSGGETAGDLRAYLFAAGIADGVGSFSLPDGAWAFPAWGLKSGMVLAIVGTFFWWPRVSHPAWPTRGISLGVLLLVFAVIWDLFVVGGFVWVPQSGASLIAVVLASTALPSIGLVGVDDRRTYLVGLVLALSMFLALMVV